MQRLFSNFASGWPGAGLFVQRLVAGALLIHDALLQTTGSHPILLCVAQSVAAALLLVGLGTPFVGTVVALIELWIALSTSADVWSAFVTSGLAATLAMIGPGAWSIDACLFGRKHVEIGKNRKGHSS